MTEIQQWVVWVNECSSRIIFDRSNTRHRSMLNLLHADIDTICRRNKRGVEGGA